jgi:hypothetical protein
MNKVVSFLFVACLFIMPAVASAHDRALPPPPPNHGFTTSVPELDPGSIGSALALLAGGALVIGAKRRKQA